MSSFVSWAGKVLDSVDEGAASALQKALNSDRRGSSGHALTAAQEQTPISDNNPTAVDLNNSETSGAEQPPLDSKDEQIIGLTKIWNETRDELARVKSVLRSRDDAHRQAMQKLREQMEIRVSETVQSSAERISILEQRLEEAALNRTVLQNQVDAMTTQIEQMSVQNSALLQEKEELKSELDQTVLDHLMQIQALQEEFSQKAKDLQDNALVASGSLQQFRDLEAKFLKEKELYTNSLVQADRDLQRMAGAARNVVEEKQKLQAEFNALQANLSEVQLQLQKASKNEQEALHRAADAEARIAAALQEQSESFQEKSVRLENHIAHLSARLKAASADPGLLAKAETLQRKVETLTAALLQRQSEIEKIGSISSTLGSQLDIERARSLQLEEERRALEQRLSEVINSPDYDDNFKRRRLRPYQHKAISKFLDFVDGVGTRLTRAMRGSAVIRIALVIYIVLLHIWCFYILSLLTRAGTTPPSPMRL